MESAGDEAVSAESGSHGVGFTTQITSADSVVESGRHRQRQVGVRRIPDTTTTTPRNGGNKRSVRAADTDRTGSKDAA